MRKQGGGQPLVAESLDSKAQNIEYPMVNPKINKNINISSKKNKHMARIRAKFLSPNKSMIIDIQ